MNGRYTQMLESRVLWKVSIGLSFSGGGVPRSSWS